MIQAEGITTLKNDEGEITHVTIDVQKHKEALPLLKQLGLLEKTQFEIDCENGTSIEESRKRIHAKIDNLWPE